MHPLHEAYLERYHPDRFLDFYRSLEKELFLGANPARPIPFSHVPLVFEPSFEARFRRIADLLWGILALDDYRRLSARNIPPELRPPPGTSPPTIPFDPGRNIGCIDLHLDPDRRLRLIEFMVLPPGIVGLYPAMLDRYGAYLQQLLPRFQVRAFRPGWDRHRCEEALLDHVTRHGPPPRRIAVIDWEPETQTTYGEFLYTVEQLRRRRGVEGVVADPRSVKIQGSRVLVAGRPVERILNRLTLVDWRRHRAVLEDYTRLLWEAPEIFVYHPYLWFLGDKASLTLLSEPGTCALMGLAPPRAREILSLVPLTLPLANFLRRDGTVDTTRLIERFGAPSRIVLKPLSSHASRGIVFGPTETPTLPALEERLRALDPAAYVAMEYVPTPRLFVPRGGGRRELWSYDLRIFILDGRYVFPGGRVYFGDYTNQLPCRGFAPLFFA